MGAVVHAFSNNPMQALISIAAQTVYNLVGGPPKSSLRQYSA